MGPFCPLTKLLLNDCRLRFSIQEKKLVDLFQRTEAKHVYHLSNKEGQEEVRTKGKYTHVMT